jgi:ribosomal protein S18 acetylase RimI-like enzyme
VAASQPRCSALPRPAACTAAETAPAAPPSCVVRPARGEADCWRVASLIRSNFYPRIEPQSALGRFIEWDRALGLRYANKGVPAGSRFECLVASAGATEAEADAARRWARQQLGSDAAATPGEEPGEETPLVVACASVDTLPGRFERRVAGWPWPLPVPPLPGLAPAGITPRGTRIAYVSSLCVAATHRRRGIARALLRAAEAQASDWGCSAAALHCAVDDEPLRAMYRSAGYRFVYTEPAWTPPLQLRSTRLALFVKRLRRVEDAVDTM